MRPAEKFFQDKFNGRPSPYWPSEIIALLEEYARIREREAADKAWDKGFLYGCNMVESGGHIVAGREVELKETFLNDNYPIAE